MNFEKPTYMDIIRRKLAGSFSLMVLSLSWLSGSAVVAMMLITAADVICRVISRPLTGAYDLVRIMAAVSAACAIPYTTAIKGHVAIEYFFHKLHRRGRIFTDAVVRLIGIGLFAGLSWQSARYGNNLRQIGQVSATLQLPIFWLPYLISFCCAVTIGVIIYNLSHPGKEMIKP